MSLDGSQHGDVADAGHRLSLGLWKCWSMGVLPSGTGDWLQFETRLDVSHARSELSSADHPSRLNGPLCAPRSWASYECIHLSDKKPFSASFE